MYRNTSPHFRRQMFSRSIQEWVMREELSPSCPETHSSSSELFVLERNQIHIHGTEGSGKQSMFKSSLCQAEMLHKVEEKVLWSQLSLKCQILTAFQRQDAGLDGPIVWLRLTDFSLPPFQSLSCSFLVRSVGGGFKLRRLEKHTHYFGTLLKASSQFWSLWSSRQIKIWFLKLSRCHIWHTAVSGVPVVKLIWFTLSHPSPSVHISDAIVFFCETLG